MIWIQKFLARISRSLGSAIQNNGSGSGSVFWAANNRENSSKCYGSALSESLNPNLQNWCLRNTAVPVSVTYLPYLWLFFLNSYKLITYCCRNVVLWIVPDPWRFYMDPDLYHGRQDYGIRILLLSSVALKMTTKDKLFANYVLCTFTSAVKLVQRLQVIKKLQNCRKLRFYTIF
jgi:hypothetical protein